MAARALGDLGDKKAVPALIDALKAHSRMIQTQAAIALGKIGDHRAVEPLRALSRHGHYGPGVAREMAIEAIVQIEVATNGSPETLLTDQDYGIRAMAVKKLAEKGGSNAVSKLADMRIDDTEAVRWAVADGLGQIHSEESRHLLLGFLSDNSASVRAKALEGLGNIGDHSVVAYLTAALSDENLFVCEAAARALGKLGDPSAVLPLRTALAEVDKRRCLGVSHAYSILSDALRSCERSN